MGSNSFGNHFKITTWGESHGSAIGVVIDGCPAGLEITVAEINAALAKRRPGALPWTSPRKELDEVELHSGVYQGQTTGVPISLLIRNTDAQSVAYTPISQVLRPSHAQYTYLQKYGIYDPAGGGRASGRETACRVAAGCIAKKIVEQRGIKICCYLKQIGSVSCPTLAEFRSIKSALFCTDEKVEQEWISLLEKVMKEGDSIGGVVEAIAWNVPAGLGDPVYDKLPARLAFAMLSIPACKGFEIGEGFGSASMQGSDHNDHFVRQGKETILSSNHAGGTLGGISSGAPLTFRVAFKPTSSIKHAQPSVNLKGEEASFQLPQGSRHDPCLAIRAVSVVEAMLSLVLVDSLLANRQARLSN